MALVTIEEDISILLDNIDREQLSDEAVLLEVISLEIRALREAVVLVAEGIGHLQL